MTTTNANTVSNDLTREQAEDILNMPRELNYFAQSKVAFRGAQGWVTWVMMVTQGAIGVFGFWCLWRMSQASDVTLAVKWGIFGAVMVLGAFMLKLAVMPRMQADRVLRAIRRLEAQLTLK